MGKLRDALADYILLVEAGKAQEAIARHYSTDVVVRENRTLSRAGREECLEFEEQERRRHTRPPRIKAQSFAADEATDTSFIEWQIRFVGSDDHVMLLEEVAVQRWNRDRIVEERFYYEGYVDEGPADDDF
jgi:ketosteroid isomerase-like protein